MRNFLLSTTLLATVFCSAQTPAPSAAPPSKEGAPPQGEQRMRRMTGTGGVITAMDANSITIKTFNGKTAAIALTDKTRFSKDRQPAKLSDFKVGDSIMVRGESAGEDKWTAAMVGQMNAMMSMMRENLGKTFIAGEIKKIDEAKITILRPDGVTQEIEADENTSFMKQRESITMADIKVGDNIMGQGEVKNGIFVPKTLRVGNMPMQMMAPAQ